MFDYNAKTGEMWIYDEITGPDVGGIDSGSVIKAIEKIGGKDLTVRINSPGGSVPEGIAIFNALSRHRGRVTTINEALAASISNYIFMSGDVRMVADNSLSMVHLPWSLAMGNADDMRAMADLLDKAGGILQKTYAVGMDMSEDDVQAMMEAETWMNAGEAVSSGMAHAIGSDIAKQQPAKVAAHWFNKTPEDLQIIRAAGSRTPFFVRQTQAANKAASVRARYGIT